MPLSYRETLLEFCAEFVHTSYLVKIKGIRWPKCIDSDEGPLPVYRKKGLRCS